MSPNGPLADRKSGSSHFGPLGCDTATLAEAGLGKQHITTEE